LTASPDSAISLGFMVEQVYPQDSDAYPAELRHLDSPPALLWCRGRLPRPAEPLLTIVGSRAASGAGCRQAFTLAQDLAAAGYGIVSGGALGIDAAAHGGALEAGGATFAVLGCGLNVTYPDRHKDLFARVAETGGLLSEYPPDTPPRRSHFPSRNRILAALGATIIVVEASMRSGALITARLAGKLGHGVLAVPGSAGTDSLLASGAALPIASSRDITHPGGQSEAAPSSSLPEPYQALMTVLRQGPCGAPLLSRELARPLSAIFGLLTEAEIDGWVRRKAGGIYEAVLHAS
jgi:DNA processing protein